MSRSFGPVNSEVFATSLTVLTLPEVPAGAYVLAAKVTIRSATGTTFTATNCQLRSGRISIDQTRTTIPGGATAAPISLQGTAAVATPGAFSVVCSVPGNAGFASDSKLSAIRVDEVSGWADGSARIRR